jgi:hypothetical protein
MALALYTLATGAAHAVAEEVADSAMAVADAAAAGIAVAGGAAAVGMEYVVAAAEGEADKEAVVGVDKRAEAVVIVVVVGKETVDVGIAAVGVVEEEVDTEQVEWLEAVRRYFHRIVSLVLVQWPTAQRQWVKEC